MSSKLFNKDIKKSCLWCLYGKKSDYTNDVFCKKHGVTTANDYCKKYKYDPLKRTPERQIAEQDFNKEDFSL